MGNGLSEHFFQTGFICLSDAAARASSLLFPPQEQTGSPTPSGKELSGATRPMAVTGGTSSTSGQVTWDTPDFLPATPLT